MKSTFTVWLLASVAIPCLANDGHEVTATRKPMNVPAFDVERHPLGSGTPATGYTEGEELAHVVADGLYHVPNYMPGYPTAAVIWPREVPVECDTRRPADTPSCTGYRVHPATGRGEYIFVRPYAKPLVTPPMVIQASPPPLPVTYKKPLE